MNLRSLSDPMSYLYYTTVILTSWPHTGGLRGLSVAPAGTVAVYS